MRTLKFRAYDSATGKVSEPFDVKESWGDYLIDFEDYSTDGALDSIIWEQFTGLLDRNGKEIYEGDIVKTNSPDRANFNAGAIVMQQQMYLIINTPTYGDARLSHSEPLGYYCDMECEVIGNIHEKSELLEDENGKN